MEMTYFTIAAIALYLISDWLLNRIEKMAGKRFEYRSVIFFAIIMLLSFLLFNLIQYKQTGTIKDAPVGKLIKESAPTEANETTNSEPQN